MSPLVSRAVNKFINLNVAEQVTALQKLTNAGSCQKNDGPSLSRLLPFQAQCAWSGGTGMRWSQRRRGSCGATGATPCWRRCSNLATLVLPPLRRLSNLLGFYIIQELWKQQEGRWEKQKLNILLFLFVWQISTLRLEKTLTMLWWQHSGRAWDQKWDLSWSWRRRQWCSDSLQARSWPRSTPPTAPPFLPHSSCNHGVHDLKPKNNKFVKVLDIFLWKYGAMSDNLELWSNVR